MAEKLILKELCRYNVGPLPISSIAMPFCTLIGKPSCMLPENNIRQYNAGEQRDPRPSGGKD